MGRSLKPKGKIVRRLGVNIFGNPKFDKLLAKKPHGPGKSPRARKKKISLYSMQLIEKQKIKYCYGVSEKQLRAAYKKATVMQGQTGHNMLILLERRLDNAIYQLGMAETREQARQYISHGHILVNEKPVKSPNFLLKKGDTVEPKNSQKSKRLIERVFENNLRSYSPKWLETDKDNLKGLVTFLPLREDISIDFKENLVVEYYAKSS